MPKISILGMGGWGTALAVMLCQNGHDVTLWSKFPREVEDIRRDGENTRLLPGVKVPEAIRLTTGLAEAVADAQTVVSAVPSFAVRETARAYRAVQKPGVPVVNVAKGLEEDSLKRLSEVLGEELPGTPVAVLSGPSHAEEVSRGIPTAVVVASAGRETALAVQELFMNPEFRIYANPDLVGVELGGALKNVIALAAGVCDGLKLGDNTKAALMTRGITEMARLGVALGGNAQTFAGLTGIGDLIVTCTSMHSRNRRAGILIGEGCPPEEAVRKIGMTVEGYRTTHAAYRLSQKAGVEMPIVAECYNVLYRGKDARTAIRDLMSRKKKHEIEDAWLNTITWD